MSLMIETARSPSRSAMAASIWSKRRWTYSTLGVLLGTVASFVGVGPGRWPPRPLSGPGGRGSDRSAAATQLLGDQAHLDALVLVEDGHRVALGAQVADLQVDVRRVDLDLPGWLAVPLYEDPLAVHGSDLPGRGRGPGGGRGDGA